MWQGKLLIGIAGLSGGVIVAAALSAFVIELGMIPRYAGITHTAKHMLLYEDTLILGATLGNVVSIYHVPVHLGKIGVGIVGLCFGIFLGSWIIALGEVVNIFAIMARRVGLKKGTGCIVTAIAIGKVAGCLIQFFLL